MHPGVPMTEAEWQTSTDAVAMIALLRQLFADDQATLDRMLHRYYLACCRAIWKLLPDRRSRNAIVVAERYLEGQAGDDDLYKAEWSAEAIAFGMTYEGQPKVHQWIAQVEALPVDELRAMIHPPEAIANLSTHTLLTRAAWFADFAVSFTHLVKRRLPWSADYFLFLSPQLLRDIFGNPFTRRKNEA
jgi:hypothetical protein